MAVKRQISARIDTSLINDYVEEFQKYRKLTLPDYPVKDLTVTQILEESLFFATKYLEEKNTAEK